MKITQILMGWLMMGRPTDAYAPLQPKMARKATEKLNKFREEAKPKAQDMQKIKYDYEAQSKLDQIIESHLNDSPRWLFEVNPNPPYDTRQNMNGYFIGKQIGMSEPFWGWHDTCGNLGQNCILTNFNFRMAQYKECFKFSNCNATDGSYNRFKSCETPLNEVGSGSKCSFAWVYMGQMLRANINRMACAVLEAPGWKPPHTQANSYWCYTDGSAPLNDQPYQPKLKG